MLYQVLLSYSESQMMQRGPQAASTSVMRIQVSLHLDPGSAPSKSIIVSAEALLQTVTDRLLCGLPVILMSYWSHKELVTSGEALSFRFERMFMLSPFVWLKKKSFHSTAADSKSAGL